MAPEAVAVEQRAQRLRFLEEDDARRERVHRLAFPVLQEALHLFAAPPRRALGVLLVSAEAYPEVYRPLASERWGLDRPGLRIQHVAPGSPADAAGVRPGDRLVAIGDNALPADPPAAMKLVQAAVKAGGPVALGLERAGATIEVGAEPAEIADYPIRLRYLGEINARATGGSIELNRAIVDFCESDTELAFILAHELAHNALRHHRDYVLNYLAGTAADLALLFAGIPTPNAVGVVNTLRPSPDFESEADYVALFLLARMGYDLDGVLDLWPRLAALQPEKQRHFFFFSTHPDYATRQARLRAAIAQIGRLQAEGKLGRLPAAHGRGARESTLKVGEAPPRP